MRDCQQVYSNTVMSCTGECSETGPTDSRGSLLLYSADNRRQCVYSIHIHAAAVSHGDHILFDPLALRQQDLVAGAGS